MQGNDVMPSLFPVPNEIDLEKDFELLANLTNPFVRIYCINFPEILSIIVTTAAQMNASSRAHLLYV